MFGQQLFGQQLFGQQLFGQQLFGQQPSNQQHFTGGFNAPQQDNMNQQQPPWPICLGGPPASFNFPSSPQSPDAASENSSFSSFSSQATNTPNTSYASSLCSPDPRDCSPAPLFANAFKSTQLDPLTPAHKSTQQPIGLPTPPSTQQPGTRFFPPTPAPFTPSCAQCTTPLPTHKPLSCGHLTCPPCARGLFLSALGAAASGSPFSEARCCAASTLPLAAAGPVLDHYEFTAYRERIVEAARAPDQRRYCHDPRCGMLLRLDRPRSGMCALCGDRTCTRCGRRSHRVPCAPGTEFQVGGGARPWVAEY
ncbi:hypothetical protein QBC39DRAFT_373426 [Podospora conica]|nr:hypothetical protein QBC39DRAFT_373426 [Schizothecium conicum]